MQRLDGSRLAALLKQLQVARNAAIAIQVSNRNQGIDSANSSSVLAEGVCERYDLNLERLNNNAPSEIWIMHKILQTLQSRCLDTLELMRHTTSRVTGIVHSWRQAVLSSCANKMDLHHIKCERRVESLRDFSRREP
jgi:hypothetical protein